LDLECFERLKKEIQIEYLKNHSPSEEDISQWKGIDIVYFQEDLRKKVKGSISEKTFYTYFKSTNIDKLPRIDMLNMFSAYIGYQSWYEFKKSLWQDTIKLLSLTKKQIEKIEAVIVKCLDKTEKKKSVNIITFLMDEKNKCTLKFKNEKLLTSHYNIYSVNDAPLIKKQEINVEKECQILLKKDSPKIEFSAIEVNALDESERFVQFQLGMDMEHNCCEWFDVVLEKEFEKVYVGWIELEIEENMENYIDLKEMRSRRAETGIICKIFGKDGSLLTKGYVYNVHNGYYSHKVILQENGEYDIIEI